MNLGLLLLLILHVLEKSEKIRISMSVAHRSAV